MKLFADGADFDGIVKASENPRIVGFTTQAEGARRHPTPATPV